VAARSRPNAAWENPRASPHQVAAGEGQCLHRYGLQTPPGRTPARRLVVRTAQLPIKVIEFRRRRQVNLATVDRHHLDLLNNRADAASCTLAVSDCWLTDYKAKHVTQHKLTAVSHLHLFFCVTVYSDVYSYVRPIVEYNSVIWSPVAKA